MSKTISTSGNPPDIDGRIVDGNESLAQRIRCAFRFHLGEYFLDNGLGLDYKLIFDHQITIAQVAQIMLDTIRNEGGNEITDITDVEYSFDKATREFSFSCNVETIYGNIEINEGLSND